MLSKYRANVAVAPRSLLRGGPTVRYSWIAPFALIPILSLACSTPAPTPDIPATVAAQIEIQLASAEPTETPKPTYTPIPTPTVEIPTATLLPQPTPTQAAIIIQIVAPTSTPTPEPTPTEVSPTATPTVEPTATPTPQPTSTEVPATESPIPTPTATPLPTATPTPMPTATPAQTNTPVPTVTPDIQWRQYSNRELAFEITYPSNWYAYEDDISGVTFYSPEGETASVTVFALETSQDSPATWLSGWIEYIRENNNPDLLEVLLLSDNKSFGNGQWAYTVYRYSDSSTDCIEEQDNTMVAFPTGYDYSVTFKACEEDLVKYEDIFNKMWLDFDP